MKASMFKRLGRWYAKYQLETWPKEKRVSLRTSDKRIANLKFEKLLTDYELVDAGKLAPLSTRDAAQRALPSLCAAFLSAIEEETTAGTVKKYASDLRVLQKENGWTQLGHVTERAMRDWLKGSKKRATTRNNCLATWHRFFGWLKRQRLVVENVCEFIDAVDEHRTAREYRRALTANEVGRLLATAPKHRSLVYRVILESGLRRSELRALRVGDFVFASVARGLEASRSASRSVIGGGGANPKLVVATNPQCSPGAAVERSGTDGDQGGTEGGPKAVSHGAGGSLPPEGAGEGAWGGGSAIRVPASIAKNRKSVLLPIGDSTASELLSFFGPDAAPFQRPFANCIPRGSTIRRDLAKAGIPFLDALGRRADLHALRKTFGTALVLSGAQPRVVMEAMRHSDLQLTMKTYMDAAQLQGPVAAAVACLPWHREATQAKSEIA